MVFDLSRIFVRYAIRARTYHLPRLSASRLQRNRYYSMPAKVRGAPAIIMDLLELGLSSSCGLAMLNMNPMVQTAKIQYCG